MNPLEDAIVALRPIAATNHLPFFKVPNSVRLLDPTQPQGGTMNFTNINPLGNPVTVTNELTNFGWEYVDHCHLLGHEENDMMRPMCCAVPPEAPTGLTATHHTGRHRISLDKQRIKHNKPNDTKINNFSVHHFRNIYTSNSNSHNIHRYNRYRRSKILLQSHSSKHSWYHHGNGRSSNWIPLNDRQLHPIKHCKRAKIILDPKNSLSFFRFLLTK